MPTSPRAGNVEVIALNQVDGTLQFPVEVTLTDMTFMPTPDSGSPGCMHVDAVTILLEE